MNRNNTDKLLPRERVYLMSAVAERDKLLSEQAAEIAHYRRQYELAVERRLRERRERSERRKDIITAAVLLAVVAFVFLPMCVMAFRETVLWAAGL